VTKLSFQTTKYEGKRDKQWPTKH